MRLLERESFLRTLAEYAGEARQGDGRLVLICGESGIGKTALVEAFRPQVKGARWLWGGCDGLLTPRPLGPLFDIAAQAGGELARLCGQGAARDQLFAAFLAELDGPAALTVAVIEDVHWADEASIDLLSFLGRRLSRMKALLLVTYRDDELGDGHPLRMVLGDLATQRATRRMGLPPLSEQAVRALAGREDADPAELYRVTGGNPFYLCEVLEAGWPCVPPTVRDMVGARMARLSPAAREAAQVAAVIGTRVGRPLLASVLPGPASVIDECLASGILIADGTGARFRHELVRMAAEEAISPHRKAELHERLLAALEAAGDVNPALLAHHAEGGGDKQAVRRYAPAAARRSSALGAHREAAAQFERALRFADEDDRPVLAGLYEALAGECSLLDRWPEAEQALRAALALRRELGDHLAVGKDLSMLSGTQWQLCRGEESAQDAEEAVRILEALPPGPELAWAYVNVAISRWGMAQPDAAFAGLKQGRDLGERLGQTGVVSRVLTSQGAIQVDRDLDGTALMEQGLRIALDAGLQAEAGSAYTCLVRTAVSACRNWRRRSATTPREWLSASGASSGSSPAASGAAWPTRCCCWAGGMRRQISATSCWLSRASRPRTSSTRCASWPASAAAAATPVRGSWRTRRLALAEGIRESGMGRAGTSGCARNCTGYRASLVRPPRKPARPTTRPPGGLIVEAGSLVIWLFRLGAPVPAELPPACPSRTRGRWPATGPARPRPGSGSAGPTTPRWPGSAAPTRPRCATRWPPSTPSAPGPPPPRPGGG